MSYIFLFSLLLSFVGFVVGLIKPSWIRMPSRARVVVIMGGAMFFFFALVGITAPPHEELVAEISRLQGAPTKSQTDQKIKAEAQKKLSELMVQSIQDRIVKTYDFENERVVYVGKPWYEMNVTQKRIFMSRISELKGAATEYHHFEVRDAYSGEKVGEVTAFLGSIEIYK